jgi:hypothetical protein
MIRCAIINTTTNAIENVVEYDTQPANPPPGFAANYIAVANDSVGLEWSWNGTALVPPIVAPAPPFVPQSISDRQFFQQLAVQGIITQADALASNAAVIPPPLLTIINAMPTDQQFSAKMIISGATVYDRTDPLTIEIGTAYGWTSAQIDAFFTAAAAL